MKKVLLLLFTFLPFFVLQGQQQTEEITLEDSSITTKEALPYSDEEFSNSLLELRRAEKLFLGSIPFTFGVSMLGYDFYKYAEDNFANTHQFGSYRNREDYSTMIKFSLGMSLAIVLTDWLLGKLQ